MPRHPRVSMQVSSEQLRTRFTRRNILDGEGNRSPLRRPLPPIVLPPKFYFRIFALIPPFFPLPSSLSFARTFILVFLSNYLFWNLRVRLFFLLTRVLKLNEANRFLIFFRRNFFFFFDFANSTRCVFFFNLFARKLFRRFFRKTRAVGSKNLHIPEECPCSIGESALAQRIYACITKMQLTCSVNRSDEFRGTNTECWEARFAGADGEGYSRVENKIETRRCIRNLRKKRNLFFPSFLPSLN